MTTERIKNVNIEEEMKSSYLDYAMSVIVARALPDVRDGLKPVHRRILYAMSELGLAHNTAFKKSVRIVGEVLGKYHPHGDSSVYDAMVRMAQDFSMRYQLVDGQGNFGSIDDDPAAAMRYTEARLTEIAEQMLLDIDKDTVDFQSNFDDSLKEPTVLPTRLPQLLVNGSSGIAVGMATNIPPHNLTEVCEGIDHLIDNPNATIEELNQFIKGPDFPTGGVILGEDGIQSAYATGRGRMIVRAKAYVSDMHDGTRRQIIVNELPYQVNKAALIEKIAELVSDKKITGIGDLRDESDRQGMRIVIELKRDVQPETVLNNLYKYTAMQSTFAANMLVMIDGQPKVINIREALQAYIDFRREVITRRTKFELKGARARAHILEGLRIALDNIDKVIAIIRKSETTDIARQNLMGGFSLSKAQADAILEMPLRRLAGLERKKILDELAELLKTISYLEDLLGNASRVLALIKQETNELKEKFGDERRTEINQEGIKEFREEDLIPHAEMAVILSNRGFIKRLAVVNLFSIPPEEKVSDMVVITNFDPNLYLLMGTRNGEIKKTSLDHFTAVRSSGLIGMDVEKDDELTSARIATEQDDVVMVTQKGQSIRFPVESIRTSQRTSGGVKGIKLFDGDTVVGMGIASPGSYVLVVSTEGYGKLTQIDRYPKQHRAGSGVRTIKLVDKTGELADARIVSPSQQVMFISANGIVTRTPVKEISILDRSTQGVRLMRMDEGDHVVAVAHMETT